MTQISGGTIRIHTATITFFHFAFSRTGGVRGDACGVGAWTSGSRALNFLARILRRRTIGIFFTALSRRRASGKFAIGASTPDGGSVGADLRFKRASDEVTLVLREFQKERPSRDGEENKHQSSDYDFSHDSLSMAYVV